MLALSARADAAFVIRYSPAILLSFLSAGAAACATPAPLTAPEPMQLVSPLSPPSVVQRAVALLAAKGFTVTTSDAANGILVATHDIGAGAAHYWLACPWQANALGWRVTIGTLTVTVTATPKGAGSAVNIVGTTRTTTALGATRVDSDAKPMCVSGGQAETAIAKAITS